MEREIVEVELRKIANTESGYIAVVKKFGRGVFFSHISDDIWGVIILNRFMEMVRLESGAKKVVVRMTDKKVEIKSEFLLDMINKPEELQIENP
jgi:hypothetical protein